MAKPLIIEVSDLQSVCKRLLDHLEHLGYRELEMPFDSYWHVVLGDAFEPAVTPTNLGLGSLEEDWAELEELIGETPRRPLVPDFRALASILNAVNRAAWELPAMRGQDTRQ